MSPAPVILARNAMNTRFELVLHGERPTSLRAAAEAALTEVERIEAQLSLFRSSSEIARVNALAAYEPVRVSPEVFRLLAHAQQLTAETGGAFDITLAPLLRCWGLLGRSDGRLPSADELAAARALCGMALVELNRTQLTVRFAREGVMLDLGAIGKGYAVEQAADILREAGVTSALIHGGTSTVFAIGTPPEAKAWKIAIERPPLRIHAPEPTPDPSQEGNSVAGCVRNSAPLLGGAGGGFPASQTKPSLATIPLRDESLSVSAVSGKCFVADGRTLGHVLDPRTGQPAAHAQLAAVVLPAGTETDALSTALLVMGPAGFDSLTALRPQMRALVTRDKHPRTVARGIELNPAASV